MSNFFDITSNVIHFGSAGQALGAGDNIYVSFGVQLAGLTSGAATTTWDGIEASQTTGAGITATIEGMVVGSNSGIAVDHVGSNNIVIGTGASVISTSATGYGIYLGAGANNLVNQGQITAPEDGLFVLGSGGNTITNAGIVSTSIGDAIVIAGNLNTITNTGAVIGGNGGSGIGIDGELGEGAGGNIVSNSGQVSGTYGISVEGLAGSLDEIDNSGAVQAVQYGIIASTGAMIVSNSGHISGVYGVQFDALNGGDQLNNTGTIHASGQVAVLEKAAAAITIVNSGSIVAAGNAIEDDQGLVDLHNGASGTIASSGGVGVAFAGDDNIVNHGEIAGGVELSNGDNFVYNTGKITSDSNEALGIGGGGNSITNHGEIYGGYKGIYIAGAGAEHGGDTLENSGTIDSETGIQILAASGDVSSIHNSGAIAGSAIGIYEDGGSLKLANDGKVSGSIAIQLSGTQDAVHNSGTIVGVSSAIFEFGTGPLSVFNTGHIVGDIDFGDGGSTYKGVLGTLDGAVNGGAGNDTIRGGADGEILNGGGGNDLIKGGTGDDVIDGGAGADKLFGGGGNDTFAYTGATESRGTAHDTVVGFDALSDTFDFEVAVTGVDTAIKVGTLDKAAFGADMAAILTATALHAHDAVLVTPNAGDLAGHTYLVVDDNGTAGFQATADYVIEFSQGVNLASLSTSNFV